MDETVCDGEEVYGLLRLEGGLMGRGERGNEYPRIISAHCEGVSRSPRWV